MSTMLKTDGTLLCDPSAATPPATDTLAVALTDTTSTAITLTSGANVVNGAYIQVDTERMLVVSGTGASRVVERGAWGTTAATHLCLATVNVPGSLTMNLLAASQVPNQSVKIRKSTPTVPSTSTLSNINFVNIVAAGTDVFPGGSTSLILPDSTTANGMVTITFPGAGTPRVLMVSSGGGVTGPPGPPGGGGVTPPSAISVTGSITGYQQWANDTQPVFGGVITLATSDPNYSHDKFFTVEALSPSGGPVIPLDGCVFDAPFTGSTITYSGSSSAILQTAAAQPGWGLKVTPLNEFYEPGTPTLVPSDYPTHSLTIAAAGVTSATITDMTSLRWQGVDTALNSVIEVVCGGAWLGNVCMWIDKGHGAGKEFQGWDALTFVGQPLYIGFPTAANLAPPSEITRLQGLVAVADAQTTGEQHPPTTGDETWTMYLAPWSQEINDTNLCPTTTISQTFTAVSIGILPPTAITGIQFVADPATGDLIDYASVGNGQYDCVPHELQWTQPDLSADPDYWFSFPTVQKGYSTTGIGTVTGTTTLQSASGAGFNSGQVGFVIHINGIWNTIATYVDSTHVTLSTPVSNGTGLAYEIWNRAPDWEGDNGDPNLVGNYTSTMSGVVFFGRKLTDSGQLQGGNSVPGTTVQYVGDNPPDWSYPPPTNPDGTTNLYRTYRYLLYAVSRRGTNTSGGTGVYTLQTWPDGTDHGDLTPAVQIPSLDLSQSTASSLTAPLIKDPSTGKPTVALQGISEPYLANNAASARVLGANAITTANSQTVIQALALVDSLIASVGLSKLGSGTTISNNVSIFTTDVVLSRGSGYPLIDLSYGGIYLYGVGSGSSGLASLPYVAVQNTGVLVSAGGSGPSVQVGGGFLTLYSVNGDLTQPFVGVTGGGLTIRAPIATGGYFTTSVSASGITLSNASGVQVTIDTTGVTLAPGTNLISPVIIVIGSPFVIKLDPTNGLVVTSGTVSASLTSGSLTCSSASIYTGGYQAGIFGIGNVPSNAAIQATVMSGNAYISIFKAGVIATYSYNGISIPSLPTSPGAQGSLWTDPADSYRVKWVN